MPTDMDAQTLWWLRQHLRRRTQEIESNLLQVPEYPPLPACPTCRANPQEIRHADDLVTFKPCGHQYFITEAAKLDLLP